MLSRDLHLDEEELLASILNAAVDLDVQSHLKNCARCIDEQRRWRRVAEATHAWGVSNASVDLAPTALSRAQRSTDPEIHEARDSRSARGVVVVAAAIAIIVAVTIAVVSTRTSAPSSAAIIQEIRHGSVLAEEAGSVHADITARYPAALGAGLPVYRYSETWNPISHDGIEQISASYLPDAHGTIITVGLTSYAQVTLPGIKQQFEPWFTYNSGAVRSDPASISPESPGRLAGVVGDVVSLGPTRIKGQSAAGYDVTVSVAELIKQARTTGEQALYRKYDLPLGIKTWKARVWIDNEDHILRVTYQLRPDRPIVTETYSYSSKRLVVKAPVAPRATRVSDYGVALAKMGL